MLPAGFVWLSGSTTRLEFHRQVVLVIYMKHSLSQASHEHVACHKVEPSKSIAYTASFSHAHIQLRLIEKPFELKI